jgi:hypothetical protein
MPVIELTNFPDLEMAGCTVNRSVVISMAIHALTHLERLNLLHLFHGGNAAMAR